MQIKTIKINKLKMADYNPRKISKDELQRLKNSIEKFGYVEPIIVNEQTMTVVGGHQRLTALKELEYEEVEYIPVSLTVNEEKALNLALNKISGEWDNKMLINVLKQLNENEEDILPNTGFSDQEILYLLDLERRDKERINAMEDDVELPEEPTKIRTGDVIQLGKHRIICGDSTEPEAWRALMGDEKADLVCTSPPYNLKIKYDKYKDNKELNDYLDFVKAVFNNSKDYMKKGRYLTINIGDSYVNHINTPAKYDLILTQLGLSYFRTVYWVKPLGAGAHPTSIRNPFPRYYKPGVQTEDIMVYYNGAELPKEAGVILKYVNGLDTREKKEQKEAIPEVLLTKYAGNVWEMHTETTLSGNHPAPFPIQLPFNCIRFYTMEDEIVVDPFGGTGTTLLAAEQLRRKARIIELDPQYVQITVDRWKRMFKQPVKCINRELEL